MPLINVPLNVPVGTKVTVNINYTPNNQYGVLDLEHVLIPEGYERDGDTPEEYFRYLQVGDLYVAALIGFPQYEGDPQVGTAQPGDEKYRRVILRRKTQYILVVEYVVDAYDMEEIAACEDSMDVEQYVYDTCVPFNARVEERDAA